MLFDANFSHLKTEMNHQGSKSLRSCCLKIHTGFGEHQTSINNSRGRRRGQKAFTQIKRQLDRQFQSIRGFFLEV